MTIRIEAPNNVKLEFPDDTPHDVIHNVLDQHFGAKTTSPITADKLVRAAVAGIPVVGPLTNKLSAATAAIPGMFAKDGPAFGERYSKNLEAENAKDEQFNTEHPLASALAGVAGGTAALAPLGATRLGAMALGEGGATLGGMAARGAASGAGIGGTDAALRGNDPMMGAALGGVVGAAVPAATKLAEAALTPIANAVRGATNPEAEAMRRVAGAINTDAQRGQAGLNPQQMAAAQAANQPVANIDRGGEVTRALARSAANSSPEARAALDKTINDRFQSQSDRLVDHLNSQFHYPNAEAQSAALEQNARIGNKVNYDKAMTEGADHLDSPELQRLSGTDSVKKAMAAAEEKAHDESVMTGGSVIDPAVKNLQYWDLTRRQLSNAANQAKRQGDAEGARPFDYFAKSLNAELDRLVPSYATARAGAASHFGAQDALEAGQIFASAGNKISADKARGILAKMNPTEQKLFQDGFVSKFINDIRGTGDNRSILNKFNNSPAAREKMAVALGPQRANELDAFRTVESVMDKARGAIQGNSTTARQLMELGLAGGGAAVMGGGNPFTGDPASLITASLIWGAARGHRSLTTQVDHRVAERVGALLASNNPQQVSMGMRLLSQKKGMLAALKNADKALARSTAVRTETQPQ